MSDPRSVAALDIAERHATGLATDEELAAARAAAWDAASAAQAAWLRENTRPDFARTICVAVEGTR